mgnify:CR=1 FL=1|jgi:hypothetical protein
MNLINKILILAILIVLINHLTEGKIIQTIKNYFISCQSNVENFIGLTHGPKCIKPNAPIIPFQSQKDFPYINKNDPNVLDEETYKLYMFLDELVTPNVNNYELTKSKNKRIKAPQSLETEIYEQIKNIFNCRGYKFTNIKILSNIYYLENPRGKELEPFEFSANVSYANKFIGTVIINLECFIRADKFYRDPMFSGFLSILNIRLLNRTHPNGVNKEKVWKTMYKLEPDDPNKSIDQYLKIDTKEPRIIEKTEADAMEKANELANKMVESFENHFVSRENYDDLFIKPTTPAKHVSFQQDTENSLIPSIIEFSAIN